MAFIYIISKGDFDYRCQSYSAKRFYKNLTSLPVIFLNNFSSKFKTYLNSYFHQFFKSNAYFKNKSHNMCFKTHIVTHWIYYIMTQ